MDSIKLFTESQLERLNGFMTFLRTGHTGAQAAPDLTSGVTFVQGLWSYKVTGPASVTQIIILRM